LVAAYSRGLLAAAAQGGADPRLGKAQVTAVAALDSMKKAEATQTVAKAMQGGGWLAPPLRALAA